MAWAPGVTAARLMRPGMMVKLLQFASALTIAYVKETKNQQGQSARKFRSMNSGWNISLPRAFA